MSSPNAQIIGLPTSWNQNRHFTREEADNWLGRQVCLGLPFPNLRVRPDGNPEIGTIAEVVGTVATGTDEYELLVSFCPYTASRMRVTPITLKMTKSLVMHHLHPAATFGDETFTREEARARIGKLVQLRYAYKGFPRNSVGQVKAAVSEHEIVKQSERRQAIGADDPPTPLLAFSANYPELADELSQRHLLRVQFTHAGQTGHFDLFRDEVEELLSFLN